jgi:flagellar hook-length control protein FliK
LPASEISLAAAEELEVAEPLPGVRTAGAAQEPRSPLQGWLSPAANAPSHHATPAPMAGTLLPLEDLPQELLRRLEQAVEIRPLPDLWQADLELDPPELGPLRIRIELEGDTLRGTLRFENPELRPLLEQTLGDLEQQLSRHGRSLELSLQLDSRRSPAPERAAPLAETLVPEPAALAPVAAARNRRSLAVLDVWV